MRHYHTIVIGGGQAGLAAAYYLQMAREDFVVLEAGNDIGNIWANRYESLKLFTSSRYNNLPGLPFPGDKSHFPTKDEVVVYLRRYAEYFNLPVLTGHKVVSLSKTGDTFLIKTIDHIFTSQNVIVCTGPFQTPFIPDFSKELSPFIFQVHSSAYQNPRQLKEGATLVVGGGNSGVQIVEEIAGTGKQVYFSFSGKLKALPNNGLIQRLIFGSGITSASIHSIIGRWLKNRPEPIMGTNLKQLFGIPNVSLVGRTLGTRENKIICEKALPGTVSNVIWATGFKPDFSWIELDVFNKDTGFPIQNRGVTKAKGLYFLGLAWMYSRDSGLLGGVKGDAEYITNQLIK